MNNLNILSIDGGGIKGIISAIVLEEFENILKRKTNDQKTMLSDYFHMVSGTSTGSILAASYIAPYAKRPKFTAEDVTNMYKELGEYVFTKTTKHNIKTMFGVIGSKYGNENFKVVLNKYFGDIKLSELLKPCLITAYDTQSSEPKFFNKVSALKNSKNDFYVKDAVLASCAAPTYFPPVCIKSFDHELFSCVDGGVFANNPTLCSFVECLKYYTNHEISNIYVLSVGNVCYNEHYCYEDVIKWGTVKWIKPIIDILFDANSQVVDHQVEKIFNAISKKENYLRIALKYEKEENVIIPKIDDAKSIDTLIDMGNELVSRQMGNLENFADMILSSKE